MLSRRQFSACALCAAIGEFIATEVSAQEKPQAVGGVVRNILSKTDLPGTNFETVLVSSEIEPGAVIARHTHPGIESGIILEGGFDFTVEGQPARTYKVGEGWQVPGGVVHSAKNGTSTTKVALTYVVEKGKPLTTVVSS
jgi:quercetin dioxygenase-like cupin family protein